MVGPPTHMSVLGTNTKGHETQLTRQNHRQERLFMSRTLPKRPGIHRLVSPPLAVAERPPLVSRGSPDARLRLLGCALHFHRGIRRIKGQPFVGSPRGNEPAKPTERGDRFANLIVESRRKPTDDGRGRLPARADGCGREPMLGHMHYTGSHARWRIARQLRGEDE